MLTVLLLGFIFYFHVVYRYTECRYDVCCFVECRYAECLFGRRHYDECHYADYYVHCLSYSNGTLVLIMTYNIAILNTMDLFATPSDNDTQHNDTHHSISQYQVPLS